MPHNIDDMSQTQTLTNGDSSKSQFIDHLTSYPVVSDSIESSKQNPYVRKSIDLAQDAYNRFGKPVSPHLQGPYSVVKPYVEKADSMANDGLSYVDKNFPIVKEDSKKVKQTALDYVLWPFNLAFQGRDYLFAAYNDEWSKTGSSGDRTLFHTGKAVLSTELRVASDTIHFLQSYLGPKRDEAADWAAQKRDQLNHQFEGVNNFIHDKAGQTQQQLNSASKQADQKKEEAKKTADEKMNG